MKSANGLIAVAVIKNTGKKNDDYDLEVTIDPVMNKYRKNTFETSA